MGWKPIFVSSPESLSPIIIFAHGINPIPQYENHISGDNVSIALYYSKKFNNAWKKLKEAGLTEQLDSAKDANDAINYIFKRQMIKDLYRSYGTPQKKYLAELDKNKPKMMSMLEGLDKKARLKEEEKTKTVSKEFVW